MSHLSQSIAIFLTTFISSYGYLAIFVFMTAESALIPIPSEVTMTFAGFLCGIGIINIWIAILIGTLGNLTGSLLSFWLGRAMGEEWIRIAIKKWGKFLLMHEKDFDRAIQWFDKYDQGITFASRLLPIVRTFISLPAGISDMSVKKFAIFTFLGSFLWTTALAFIGLKLGQNWNAVEPFFRKFQFVIIGFVILAVFIYIYKHVKRGKD